jgi:hypothetical protein
MVIGFAIRTKGHSEPTDFAIYLLFQFFIVCQPDSLLKTGFSTYFLPGYELYHVHASLEVNYEARIRDGRKEIVAFASSHDHCLVRRK